MLPSVPLLKSSLFKVTKVVPLLLYVAGNLSKSLAYADTEKPKKINVSAPASQIEYSGENE